MYVFIFVLRAKELYYHFCGNTNLQTSQRYIFRLLQHPPPLHLAILSIVGHLSSCNKRFRSSCPDRSLVYYVNWNWKVMPYCAIRIKKCSNFVNSWLCVNMAEKKIICSQCLSALKAPNQTPMEESDFWHL